MPGRRRIFVLYRRDEKLSNFLLKCRVILIFVMIFLVIFALTGSFFFNYTWGSSKRL